MERRAFLQLAAILTGGVDAIARIFSGKSGQQNCTRPGTVMASQFSLCQGLRRGLSTFKHYHLRVVRDEHSQRLEMSLKLSVGGVTQVPTIAWEYGLDYYKAPDNCFYEPQFLARCSRQSAMSQLSRFQREIERDYRDLRKHNKARKIQFCTEAIAEFQDYIHKLPQLAET